jgi:short-subunit dehydrogenase
MAFDYRGRVAIVTGASSGIGRVVALDLASRGASVVAVARREDLVEAVAEECRRTAPHSRAVAADIADRASVESFVGETLERDGKIDILVNNAGMPMRVHATRLTVEDVERVMAVNFLGAVYATLAVLPAMMERRQGHIVNVSSVAGRVGSPREGAYSASKYALSGWSEVLAADLRETGVKVHLVIPGAIRTEIWDKVQEPPSFSGRFEPAEAVSRGILRAIEQDRFEVWVPRRLKPAGLIRALLPGTYVKAIARYGKRAERR